MAKESAFDLNAVSKYGALGLMQVVPRFHLDKLKSGEDVSSLREPGPNIRVAAEVLTGYLAKEGSLDRALIKYSGNSPNYPARVRRYWEKLKAIESEARRQEVPFSTPDV
jgi:soluble lytic murein transglycosylase-like protein